MVHSTDLGKLKLEHKVKKGVFISGKLYALITDKETIIKSKGVNSKSLKFDDFMELLMNRNINHAVKRLSKTDWSSGDVKIFDKVVTIFSSNYNKREKVYDKQGYWINTKPNIINSIDKSLVVDQPNKGGLTPYKSKDKSVKSDFIPVSSLTNKLYYGLLAIIILPISIIAYILTNTPFDEDTDDILDVEDNKPVHSKEKRNLVDPRSEPSADIIEDKTKVLSKEKELVETDWDSSEDNIEVVNTNKKISIGGQEYDKTDIPATNTHTKTLYENFVARNMIDSPVQDRAELAKTNITIMDIPSSSDKIPSPFTPYTLSELEKEIRNNQKALDEIDEVCNEDVKDSIKHNLLDEQKYLLKQISNHLEGILDLAKKNPYLWCRYG